MKIDIIPTLSDNYTYAVIDSKYPSKVLMIDAGESAPLIEYLQDNKYELTTLLITHHHYDHIGGNLELKEKYESKIVAFKDDKSRIPEVDVFVQNNQIWKADNFEAKIYHTPGHTSGHIAFYFFNEKKIFTGDTLFSLGCGRIFEGTYKEMFYSLNKIKKLPKETKISISGIRSLSSLNATILEPYFFLIPNFHLYGHNDDEY